MLGLLIVLVIVAVAAWFGWKKYQRSQWLLVPGKQMLIPLTKVTTVDGKVVYVGDAATLEKCQDMVIGNSFPGSSYLPGAASAESADVYNSFSYYNAEHATVPNACFASMETAAPALVGTSNVTSGYRAPAAKVESYDNKKLHKTMRMGGAGKEPMRGNKSGTSHFFANNVAGTFDAERFHARQTTVGTEWEGRY